MYWRYGIIAILLCFTLFCSGCMGSREINDNSYVLSMGVDTADDPYMYIFTFRIAIPKAFAGEGGGDSKEKTKLVSVKATDISAAIRRLAVAINRQPELGHTSNIVISEDVARQGIYGIMSYFLHSRGYGNDMFFMVTKDKAKTELEKNTAPFELFQYRWIDSAERIEKFTASYSLNDLRILNVNSSLPGASVLTAYGSLIEKSLDKKSLVPLSQTSGPEYDVNTFPREGGSELILVGSVILKDWKMIGSLNTNESFAANLLKDGIKTAVYVPDQKEENEKIDVALIIKRPNIDVDMKDGKMLIKIKVKADCELTNSSGQTNYLEKENQKQLEQEIDKGIKASIEAYFKATQPLGADCVQLSNHYRYKVNTWQEVEAINWAEVYKNAEVEIDVKSKIARSGLIWRDTEGGGRLY